MNLFRKQSKNEIDINYLNLVEHYRLVKPNNKLDSDGKRVIEFAYLPEDEKVVLIGSIDGFYPFWISETDIDDIKTNTAIVDSILHKDFSSYARMDGKLYQKLKDCYRRKILISDGNANTPFDHGYAKEQPEYWGKFIAEDICSYYKRLKNLCKERELEGRYLDFLEAYLNKLETKISSDPVKEYESKKILIDIIKSEDYLLVSDNKEIKDTYIKIRNIAGNIYNEYMTIVR